MLREKEQKIIRELVENKVDCIIPDNKLFQLFKNFMILLINIIVGFKKHADNIDAVGF